MNSYQLRNIPPELWLMAKIRSAETGIPIREMLLDGLNLWLMGSEAVEEAEVRSRLSELTKKVLKLPLPEA